MPSQFAIWAINGIIGTLRAVIFDFFKNNIRKDPSLPFWTANTDFGFPQAQLIEIISISVLHCGEMDGHINLAVKINSNDS